MQTLRGRSGLPRLAAGCVIGVALCGASAWAQSVRELPDRTSALAFEDEVIDPNGIAYERAIGDLDGDGYSDVLAMAGSPYRSLVWFKYPGFRKRTLRELDAGIDGWPYFRADALQLADIDRDGDLDAVTRIGDAGDVNGDVVWLENPRPGQPVSGTWAVHTVGACEYVKDLAVRDIDGDGRLDIIGRQHGQTEIWLQNGPADWTARSRDHYPHEGMDVGDLDGDGDGALDMILSQSECTGYPVSWYSAADPLNGPWTEHVIVPDCDQCHNLAAADFDDDGYLDVMAGGMPASPQAGLAVYLGDGGSHWTEFPIQSAGSYTAVIGDIDEDQDVDIVDVRNWDAPPTELWRNRLHDSVRQLLGDVDQDGDVDLVDLIGLLGAFDQCTGEPRYNPLADFDHSGCVDLLDLVVLLGVYGTGT